MEVNRSRFSGIFQIPEDFKVTLVGAGGIGATTGLTLAKMGVRNMVIIDDDVISDENIGTQLYKPSSIGYVKSIELWQTIFDYAQDVKVQHSSKRLSPKTPQRILDMLPSNVIISAVDSINSRKGIWKVIQDIPFHYYIDARMAAEEFQSYVVHFQNREWYNVLLERDDEDDIPELPCTAKATFYTAMMAAGHIGNLIKMIVTEDERLPRRLVHNISSNTLIFLEKP